MPFEQTRDVIEKARLFHRELRDFYHRSEEVVEKERLKLLLEYLSRHEQVMEDRLAEFEDGSSRAILDSWFQFAPGPRIREQIAKVEIRPDMSAAEIICMALRLDEILLNLYRDVAGMAAKEPVREIFTRLYEEGKKERSRLVLNVFEIE